MDLVEKTAIVTGAGRGIGKAIARQLAREGATVLVNDLEAERADAVATALQDEGLSAISFAADVSAESAVQAMVDYII
jgi:NAD(P)-dependent dehydrogenase (short-subunit alcohol dehydrogenase family)